MQIPQAMLDFYLEHTIVKYGYTLFDFITEDDAQYSIFNQKGAINLNEDLDIDDRLPGYFAIGVDGGEEVLLLSPDGEVISVPLSPMDITDALFVSSSLEELLAMAINNEED